MKLSRSFTAVVAVASAAVLAFAPSAQAATTLTASGASSVLNAVNDCRAAYTAATGDSFAYPAGGSTQGKKDMEGGKVDFAFSDSPHLTSKSGLAIPASEIHVPTWVWPVAFGANINFGGRTASLSPKTIGQIIAGKITYWDDAAIKADNARTLDRPIYQLDSNGQAVKDSKGNPVILRTVKVNQKITFPHKKITVIYRSDGSGTTANLFSALSVLDSADFTQVVANLGSDSFAAEKDVATVVTSNPINYQGASGSTGVAALAAKVPYSLVYVEPGYVKTQGLSLINVIGNDGGLADPTANGGLVTAVDVASIGSNGVVTFDYANKAAGMYPFTAVTYTLALTSYGDTTKAAAVKNMIQWHAFNCAKTAPQDYLAAIDPTSSLGKKMTSQLAKLGA